MGAPSSGTTTKLMLVCLAQVWAAWRNCCCHRPARPGLLLNVLWRLLTGPPMLVPSGMKLMVMTSGFIQALPVAE